MNMQLFLPMIILLILNPFQGSHGDCECDRLTRHFMPGYSYLAPSGLSLSPAIILSLIQGGLMNKTVITSTWLCVCQKTVNQFFTKTVISNAKPRNLFKSSPGHGTHQYTHQTNKGKSHLIPETLH